MRCRLDSCQKRADARTLRAIESHSYGLGLIVHAPRGPGEPPPKREKTYFPTDTRYALRSNEGRNKFPKLILIEMRRFLSNADEGASFAGR